MIRGLIEDYYDIQKHRLEVEGQLRASEQGVSEQEIIFVKDKVLTRLEAIEKDIYKYLHKQVKKEPIWAEWLVGVKGIGPVLAAGLISWIGDIEPHEKTFIQKFGEDKGKEITVQKGFVTISKLWRYSGLAVNGDGKAERRKAGEKMHFNPRLKTHIWKIGEAFVKTKGGYRRLYDMFRDDYDRKWKTFEDCGSIGCKNAGKCMDGHRFAAAKRKVEKVFLAHYWQKSRELKGLPIESPFIIGRDGHGHEIPIIYE